jgi:uncharacterized protein YcbX
MFLSSLFLYPVKSLRGYSVDEAAVDALGLVGDHRFLVVDASGRFLTQRTLPRMALIDTQLDSGTLLLFTRDQSPLAVPVAPDPSAPLLPVEVWSSQGPLAEDCGADAADWLTAFLQTPCRLVRIGPAFSRPMPDKKIPAALKGSGPHFVSFADAFPFLLLGEASLDDLNARLTATGSPALPINRFRPNLVVEGAPAYAEDSWQRFRIGEIGFHAGGPCARCVITTTNQLNAERGQEPLRTLATYRRDPSKPSEVNFGQNLLHETKSGLLRVGDPITLL